MTGQLAFPKMGIKVLHNLILEVIYCHAHYIMLVTQPIPGTKWKGTPEKRTRGRDHWGPSWGLAAPWTSYAGEKSEAERGVSYPRPLKILSNF